MRVLLAPGYCQRGRSAHHSPPARVRSLACSSPPLLSHEGALRLRFSRVTVLLAPGCCQRGRSARHSPLRSRESDARVLSARRSDDALSYLAITPPSVRPSRHIPHRYHTLSPFQRRLGNPAAIARRLRGEQCGVWVALGPGRKVLQFDVIRDVACRVVPSVLARCVSTESEHG